MINGKFLFILALLIIVPLIHSADDTNTATYSYYDNLTKYLKSQGNSFVQGTDNYVSGVGVSVKTVPSVFSSVVDIAKAGECGDSWVTYGPDFIIGAWLRPAMYASIMIVMGLILLYMLAQVLQSQPMVSTVKEEAFQTMMTFVRVLFLVGIIAAGNQWYGLSTAGSVGDVIYSNPKNVVIIDAAMAFTRLMIVDMVDNYSMLTLYNTIIHTIYSSTLWIGITWRSMYQFNLGAIMKPLVDLVGMALQFLGLAISEWMLHLITLCLIKRWVWGLLIPLGMFLRALPPTRGAGEALFALSFALAVIYPMMFLVDYEAHKILSYHLADAKNAIGGFLSKSGILGVAGVLLIVLMVTGGVFIQFFIAGALSIAFELVRNSVYYVVLISLLLPFFNIFITLTAAKEIAKFFSVDVNFLSFMKII
ncbi:MAG: hypothetical protein ABID61_02585 [Candidatus Micrarchaeota archaeon]